MTLVVQPPSRVATAAVTQAAVAAVTEAIVPAVASAVAERALVAAVEAVAEEEEGKILISHHNKKI